MGTSTDRIEKRTILQAPRARVWRAIANAEEFGSWFGVKLEGQFAVGSSIKGHITTPKYEHLTMTIVVVQIETERLFSYRWHPHAIDPAVDYSNEPTTLVGFDQIPAARRAEAFRMNDGGWAAQIANVERHVARG